MKEKYEGLKYKYKVSSHLNNYKLAIFSLG